MTDIRGDFYPPGLSARQAARLEVDAQGHALFKADDGGLLAEQDFDRLEISPRLGDTPRIICLETGARFETRANEAVDRLLERFRQHTGHRLLHRMERHLPLVVLFTLLVGLFVGASILYGIPALSKSIAFRLPPEINRMLGQGTLRLMDESTFSESELPPERQRELMALFRQYTDRYPQWRIQPLLRHGNAVGPNAMALPGGQIIFTDELVELAEEDGELLAILGHEIGHLEQRHLMRSVLQSSLLTVIVISVTGDVSTVSSIVYAIPTLLMELKYSREFETEADDFAYSFMQKNRLPPVLFAHILRRLEANYTSDVHPEEDDPGGDFLSTHPPTLERIRRFEEAG
jgi:Zn-dependent protease with chaperone function